MEQPTDQKTYTDYKSRINKVYDYIEENIDHEMSLEELASVANFSKYHFSRIFEAMVGETPFEFIKRVRLEKAATLLQHNDTSITQIALECGFNNLSVFSRNFKSAFGVSATEWRNDRLANSNFSKTDRNSRKTSNECSPYVDTGINMNHNMEQLQDTEVRHLSEVTVAYIRHTGPHQGDEKLFNRLFNRLFYWAGPRGLMQQELKPLVIYHDDPSVTDEEKLRISVCLPVPPDTSVEGEIGKMKLPDGQFLVARFVVAPEKMPKAWQWIYGTWLPSSGYQPADALPYEAYPKPPKDGKLTVEICVPIKPL